jgi:dTDP-4-amino-4,6-dideoxygalactose transaminase
MSRLALLGGTPVRKKLFPAHNHIGKEEKNAVLSVLDTGVLSRFRGSWDPDFYGGDQVLALEKAWAHYVDARHAVSLNSAASGLVAAVGAAGIGPGDEVIVTPYTMSATVVAILAYGGIPIFADVDPFTFCLDAASVETQITSRTKAILAVHLFGHPADMDRLLELARRHHLIVIEDAAQAPGAEYHSRLLGTFGDMTVFSLNYHKHIHTGEGGIVTTQRPELAERLQLIRNHGESVVEGKGVKDIANTFGFNLRLTEIAAAIGIEQLKKLPRLLAHRIRNVEYLNEQLRDLPGLRPAPVQPGCRHVYYVQPFLYDEGSVGIPRDRFIKAVAAELPNAEDRPDPLIAGGYVRPLYLLPLFQQQVALGREGFPFKSPWTRTPLDYPKGLCPITERLYEKELLFTEYMRPPASLEDMTDVVRAFQKVYENRKDLL